jgi:hypothetical protein
MDSDSLLHAFQESIKKAKLSIRNIDWIPGAVGFKIGHDGFKDRQIRFWRIVSRMGSDDHVLQLTERVIAIQWFLVKYIQTCPNTARLQDETQVVRFEEGLRNAGLPE